MENYIKRFSDGETQFADSIHLPDSLKYNTLVNKRRVYGGGGLMPDLFVAADTSYYTEYYANLIRKGVFNTFTLEYADKNRKKILSSYNSFDDYKSKFEFTPEEVSLFIKSGEDAGVKFNEKQFATSKTEILKILKAIISSNLWQSTEYFRIINEGDVVIDRALKVLADKNTYDRLLGYNDKDKR
jgi:carboxyl-terminal processing protease